MYTHSRMHLYTRIRVGFSLIFKILCELAMSDSAGPFFLKKKRKEKEPEIPVILLLGLASSQHFNFELSHSQPKAGQNLAKPERSPKLRRLECRRSGRAERQKL